MELKKISEEMESDSTFSWLMKHDHHGLEDYDLSGLVRVLIKKHDVLVDYIRELEQKI